MTSENRTADVSGHAGRAPCLLLALALCSLSTACESPDNGSQRADDPNAATRSAASDRPPSRVEWRGPTTVASGPGITGPWRMNDSRFHYVDDPTVRMLDDGTACIVWVDNERQNAFFQKIGPEGKRRLDTPANISKSPEIFTWLPKIAVADGGSRIYVLWQEIVFSGGSHGGEAFFARSTDGGETFDPPINLSETEDGDGKGRLTKEIWHNGSLDVALGNEGQIYAAWTAYEGDLWFSRSTDGGATFTEPSYVAGTAEVPARGPDFAVGPEGTLYLAWTVGERDAADIRIARSDDAGESFADPVVPFETDGHSDGPKITAGGDGDLHLAFADSPDGPFERYAIHYARRPADGTFPDATQRIAGPEREGVESTNFPALRLDGEGRAYLLWERYPNHRRQPRGLGFAHSVSGPKGFTRPTLVPGSADRELGVNGSLQGSLMQKLDVSENGRIAVVNSRFREEHMSRIRLYRGRLD